MASPRITGTLNPVQQPTEVSYDPIRGLFITERWESAGDNLVATADAYAASRIAYNLTRSAHKSVLVATASGAQAGYSELTTDTWQILANEIQKDVFEHNKSLGIEASWPGTLGYVKRDLELSNSGQPVGSPAPNPDAVTAGAGKLFYLLYHGTTHFALGQYVLRHTTNVSNTYAANIADQNVERIYTTAQLIAECSNVGAWVYPLPGRLQYKINNISAPTARTDYLWGWRKLPSTETTTAGNRIEITTEYWLEQWSTFIYDPKT